MSEIDPAETPVLDNPETPVAVATVPQDDAVTKALDAAKSAAELARREAEQWRETAQRAVQAFSTSTVREQEPEVDEDDPDVDPQVKALVDKKIAKLSRQIETAYLQDRQQDLAYRASLELERTARMPGWKDVEQDVRKYLEQVPVHLRAAPGAAQEAYYAIMGRRYAQELSAKEARPSPLGSQGGRSAGPTPVSALSAEDRALLQNRFGVEMTDAEVELLTKNNVVSYDEWAARRKA